MFTPNGMNGPDLWPKTKPDDWCKRWSAKRAEKARDTLEEVTRPEWLSLLEEEEGRCMERGLFYAAVAQGSKPKLTKEAARMRVNRAIDAGFLERFSGEDGVVFIRLAAESGRSDWEKWGEKFFGDEIEDRHVKAENIIFSLPAEFGELPELAKLQLLDRAGRYGLSIGRLCLTKPDGAYSQDEVLAENRWSLLGKWGDRTYGDSPPAKPIEEATPLAKPAPSNNDPEPYMRDGPVGEVPPITLDQLRTVNGRFDEWKNAEEHFLRSLAPYVAPGQNRPTVLAALGIWESEGYLIRCGTERWKRGPNLAEACEAADAPAFEIEQPQDGEARRSVVS